MLEFIGQYKDMGNISFARWLAAMERMAQTLAPGDVEGACTVAVTVWGIIARDGYWDMEFFQPETKEELVEFLKDHEYYEDLRETLAELSKEAEALEEGGNARELLESIHAIAYRLETKIMPGYFFSYPGEPAWMPPLHEAVDHLLAELEKEGREEDLP